MPLLQNVISKRAVVWNMVYCRQPNTLVFYNRFRTRGSPEMRHACRFALLPALAILSGCGMEDTGPSAINPADDVNLVFSTFNLTDENEQSNLRHTQFWDFYRGIEPATDNEDHQAVANVLRDHINVFIGGVRQPDASAYSLVRNPVDLMNQVIASNEVANFDAGRSYISDRIDASTAGRYNTRSNGALIRFEDQEATNDNDHLANRTWIYPTLDWLYMPNGSEDPNNADRPEGFESSGGDEKVYRTIQYVARTEDNEDVVPPQLKSALTGTQFDALSFSEVGYNDPEATHADYTSRSFGSIELRKDYLSGKYDTLYWRGIVTTDNNGDEQSNLDEGNRMVILGEPADCVRVELDYPMSTATVYTSNDEPNALPDPTDEDPDQTKPNPAHCGNQEPGDEAITYSTQAIPERQ